MSLAKGYLLPYQTRWLKDKSRIKIWDKSRRIGATYVQALEDVIECSKGLYDVWFTSSDDSAGEEYIKYCEEWAKKLNTAFKATEQELLDEDKDITVYKVKFKSGKTIHALSSNPKRFRSKGGKVILDEYAFHEDANKMWKAAKPTITWGFPLRILSTHNGMQCKYYQFLQRANAGELPWSVHKTDIYLAVDEGLADKILGRKLTAEERQAWLDEEYDLTGDEATWQEEYCCNPQDENTAWLPYELIAACEDSTGGVLW
jgi:phage FluMu gp28-like protein